MKYLLVTTVQLMTFCIPMRTLAQSFDTGASTYAVVVGISDYQDAAIPDLRFADRDAEAFANFLRSPAGGSLDSNHLRLLINQQANAGQVYQALDWLVEVVHEDDQAIIYFSGHGDVEKRTITQPGFLLCWDAPSRVYMSGGTLDIRHFQDFISTLCFSNKGKVLVITDTNHGAKLTGEPIYGSQLTSQNLAQQFANELKILSCQPEEYSNESEQWGGGHGVFTYYLIQGLSGAADQDGDKTVTLKEIDNYLAKAVPVDTKPMVQKPLSIGDENTVISFLRD